VKWIALTITVLVAGALGGFAIYTFGWHNTSTGERATARADAADLAAFVGCGGCYVGDVSRLAPQIWRVRLEGWKGATYLPASTRCYDLHLDQFRLGTNPAGYVLVACA